MVGVQLTVLKANNKLLIQWFSTFFIPCTPLTDIHR